jgi:hypothetical protein
MNGEEHGRAVELISLREVEGIAENDARWLESHLAQCEDCAKYQLATSGAETAVRSITVMASASLVESTQAKVHARAEQLRERESRLFLIAISFAMGVAFSTLSAWIWWKIGGWAVERWNLPASIVGPGMVLAWLLPAVCLGVLLVAFPHSAFEGSIMQTMVKDRQRGMQ